jgi:hypothetical protein
MTFDQLWRMKLAEERGERIRRAAVARNQQTKKAGANWN